MSNPDYINFWTTKDQCNKKWIYRSKTAPESEELHVLVIRTLGFIVCHRNCEIPISVRVPYETGILLRANLGCTTLQILILTKVTLSYFLIWIRSLTLILYVIHLEKHLSNDFLLFHFNNQNTNLSVAVLNMCWLFPNVITKSVIFFQHAKLNLYYCTACVIYHTSIIKERRDFI